MVVRKQSGQVPQIQLYETSLLHSCNSMPEVRGLDAWTVLCAIFNFAQF